VTVIRVSAWQVQCDRCLEFDEGAEGGKWHYSSPEEARDAALSVGWTMADDGRLLCEMCVDYGETLPELRCTCPAGRGTNPGCPVCP